MTPGDITRLADIAERLDRAHSLLELSQEQKCRESMAAKVDYASSALLGAQFALTELRATLTLAQQGKAGGVAVYEVQKKQGAIVYSGWTETTKDTYESGVFPESMFHKRILYVAPPSNPPEAGVTDALFEIVEEAFREGFASPATYNDVAENTPDESWEQKREYFRKRFRKAAALTAPQPKDAS